MHRRGADDGGRPAAASVGGGAEFAKLGRDVRGEEAMEPGDGIRTMVECVVEELRRVVESLERVSNRRPAEKP